MTRDTDTDPAWSTGNPDQPVLACRCYDIEAVCDLIEPNRLVFESHVEEYQPCALVFTASIKGSGGELIALNDDEVQPDLQESDWTDREEPDDRDMDGNPDGPRADPTEAEEADEPEEDCEEADEDDEGDGGEDEDGEAQPEPDDDDDDDDDDDEGEDGDEVVEDDPTA